MNEEKWEAVDRYFTDRLHEADPVQEFTLSNSRAAGLPDIQVSATQGKFLYLLALSCQARRILELGTLGGFSTIWLARALPDDGLLVSLESESAHAEIARENISKAELGAKVEIMEKPAIDSLKQLAKDESEPFDLVFLDADKESYPNYLPWIIELSRAGTVLVGDNVVREGAVLDANSTDSKVTGVQNFTELLAGEQRIETTVLQTVGAKGYDGFMIGVMR